MKRITIIATLALLTIVPTAHAGTFAHYEDGSSAVKFNNWIRASKIAAPNADLTIIEQDDVQATCGVGALGCQLESYDVPPGHSKVWLKRSLRERANFLHELGHVFDHAMLTDKQRARFQHIDESQGTPWQDVFTDYTARPSEHFANAYATCALLGTKVKLKNGDLFVSTPLIDYLGTIQQYRQTCKLIERASLGTGLLDYTPKGH